MIIRYRGSLLFIAACFVITFLFSCSRGDEGQKKVTTSHEKVSAKPESAVVLPGETFSVEIIPQEPTVGEDLQILYSGDVGEVASQWMRNDKPIAGATAPRLGTGHFEKGDTISVVVIADGVEKSSSVLIGNTPPSVDGITLTPEVIYRGVDITVEAAGSDPDGDEIGYEYQWFIDGEEDIAISSPVLGGEKFGRGTEVAVRVTPYDEDDMGEPFDMDPIEIPNGPPLFISTPPEGFKERTYTYQIDAVDPDGDSLEFSLSSAPEGMEIDEQGVIQWDIGDNDVGSHEVEVVISDDQGGKGYQRYSITITLSEE
ncbi:MAG: hypothetical protein GY721_07175 [Deltaproteobacteria bacterium]|nr:hypothetical protein [Deltaproteobacteria bacterium]